MLSTLIKFPLMFISGVFIPLSNLPAAARSVSYVSPLTYFTDIARFATGQASYLPVYVDFLAIVVFTVVLWIVAVRLHNRTLPKRL
jgi:ABC-2 type transport system permease protein